VLNQSFIDEFQVDGRSIDGADQVQSILSLDASAVVGRNVLLDGAVGVGLNGRQPRLRGVVSGKSVMKPVARSSRNSAIRWNGKSCQTVRTAASRPT
jgi:hypothetical protein